MAKPQPHVYLTQTGSLRINTDGITNHSLVWRLSKAHGMTAMALTTNKSDRQLLNSMMDAYDKYSRLGEARFIVTDEAAESIHNAIEESNVAIPPILSLKPYEKLGAIGEIGKLQARTTFGAPGDKSQPFIIKNEKYQVNVGNRKYDTEYSRTRMHVSRQTGNT